MYEKRTNIKKDCGKMGLKKSFFNDNIYVSYVSHPGNELSNFNIQICNAEFMNNNLYNFYHFICENYVNKKKCISRMRFW